MTSSKIRIAVTGATGFIGRSVISQLEAISRPVSALTRQPRTDTDTTKWITGTLTDERALADLAKGADVFIHIAGLTHAPSLEAFLTVNETGAANAVQTAIEAKVRRFILVSSVAAREPHLSHYAHSKQAGETCVRQIISETNQQIELVIIRPPAIIGAGDPATEPMLNAMRMGWLPAPAGHARKTGRMSFVHVDDIARFLIEWCECQISDHIITPHGGTAATGWDELAQTAGQVLSKRVRLIPVPPLFLKGAATFVQAFSTLFGRSSVFNTGKVRELLHNDWTGNTPIVNARSLEESLRLAFGMDVDA